MLAPLQGAAVIDVAFRWYRPLGADSTTG